MESPFDFNVAHATLDLPEGMHQHEPQLYGRVAWRWCEESSKRSRGYDGQNQRSTFVIRRAIEKLTHQKITEKNFAIAKGQQGKLRGPPSANFGRN
jgi:hypothetical protein